MSPSINSDVFVFEPNRHKIRNASNDKTATIPKQTVDRLNFIRQAIKDQCDRNPRSMEHYLDAYQDVLYCYFRQWED